MGANSSSAVDDQLDERTLQWLLDYHESLTDSRPRPEELRKDIPSWMGGKCAATQVVSRNSSLKSALARKALSDCLEQIEAEGSSSVRCGAHRRTICTPRKHVNVGDEVHIIHVYEIVPPLAHHVPLYEMGPKAVLGEYVDGALHIAKETADPMLVAEAQAVFVQHDHGSAGKLSLDNLWAVLRELGLHHLLKLDDETDASSGADETVARPLHDEQRANLRRIAGCDAIGEADFLALVRNLYGAGSYDGAVSEGPGVDTMWEVTTHIFDTPGVHVISWHGLEHFAGCAPSNELHINVMPRLQTASLADERIVLPSAVGFDDTMGKHAPPPKAPPGKERVKYPLRKFHYGKLTEN